MDDMQESCGVQWNLTPVLLNNAVDTVAAKTGKSAASVTSTSAPRLVTSNEANNGVRRGLHDWWRHPRHAAAAAAAAVDLPPPSTRYHGLRLSYWQFGDEEIITFVFLLLWQTYRPRHLQALDKITVSVCTHSIKQSSLLVYMPTVWTAWSNDQSQFVKHFVIVDVLIEPICIIADILIHPVLEL